MRRNPPYDPKIVAKLLKEPGQGASEILQDYLDETAILETRPITFSAKDDAAYREELIGHVARTLWLMAWADWADSEEGRDAQVDRPGAGGDWEDCAPFTPLKAFEVAEANFDKVIAPDKVGFLLELVTIANHLGPGRRPLTARRRAFARFGHDFAMQLVGSGIGIADDFDEKILKLKLPYIEFSLYDVPTAQLPMEAGGPEHRVRATYDVITPESAEQGDVAEHGWINEEGVLIELEDEGDTYPLATVRFLQNQGVSEVSSTHFHPKVWYSTDYVSNRRGGEQQVSYFLVNYTPAEARLVFDFFRAGQRARR